MTTIVKLDLISKNNLQRGSYHYSPIVKIGDDFYWCKSLITKSVIKAKDIDVNDLVIERIIPTMFHEANGLI